MSDPLITSLFPTKTAPTLRGFSKLGTDILGSLKRVEEFWTSRTKNTQLSKY